MGANLLKLKPLIDVTDGKMGSGKKYRGNIDKVIINYVDDKLRGRDDIDFKRIFITVMGVVAQECSVGFSVAAVVLMWALNTPLPGLGKEG